MKRLQHLILGCFLAIPTHFLVAQSIDLSSVDSFFLLAEKIQDNHTVSDNDWNNLFETTGYQISAQAEIRKKVVKNMMIAAFSNEEYSLRDSIQKLDLVEHFNNTELFLNRLTLDNYLEMSTLMEDLKRYRQSYDFSALEQLSTDRLVDFLVNPIDSLITFPSVNLLCYEPDAQSKPQGIVIDFNLFYKKSTRENIDFLAHEMFHTYRRHFENQEYIQQNSLTYQLNLIQNEGIADLIDKNTNPKQHFKGLNLPHEIIDMYISAYKNTPDQLKELEVVTNSYLTGKIEEDEFNNKLKYFFQFGGHPNGFYMASMIAKAGMKEQLKTKFFNPHDFIKLYNKAAKKMDGFCFGETFMAYSEQLAQQYYK